MCYGALRSQDISLKNKVRISMKMISSFSPGYTCLQYSFGKPLSLSLKPLSGLRHESAAALVQAHPAWQLQSCISGPSTALPEDMLCLLIRPSPTAGQKQVATFRISGRSQ